MEHASPIGPSFVRRLDLYGVVFEIRAPRTLAPLLAILLRGYPAAAAAAEPDVHISVLRDGQMWFVASDEPVYERSYPKTPSAGMAARHIEWLIVSEALKRWTRFVHVHAALVATADRSALLVGRSGSGKSTTSVALALAGLMLYTDDLALLDRATLRPVSLPRPPKLDHRSRHLLKPRGLVVPPRRSLGECIDRTVIPGLPPLNEAGPPLSAAVFFAGDRVDCAQIRRLTAAEAVMRLVQQSASERFDERGPTEAALAVINAVRCYELVAGDLDSTVRVVLDLLEAPGDSIVGEPGMQMVAAVA